jgi:hypothetical protein
LQYHFLWFRNEKFALLIAEDCLQVRIN